jgi:hypothetical protein
MSFLGWMGSRGYDDLGINVRIVIAAGTTFVFSGFQSTMSMDIKGFTRRYLPAGMWLLDAV